MRKTRDAAPPIGLGLVASWIELHPITADDGPELERLAANRALEPVMGSGSESGSSVIAPALLVREKATSRVVGIMENRALTESVAVFISYLDPKANRAGFGFEAVSLYISYLFDCGARRVVAEVLEFNSAMRGILSKVHLEPQARMREHVYTGGRYWDLLIYSWGRDEWVAKVVDRYRRVLPGGDRSPAAIGGKRRQSS